jgi:hypothetical protein
VISKSGQNCSEVMSKVCYVLVSVFCVFVRVLVRVLCVCVCVFAFVCVSVDVREKCALVYVACVSVLCELVLEGKFLCVVMCCCVYICACV